MSFREKSAWITLISVLLTFGAYYGALLLGLIQPQSMSAFHFGLIAIIALIILQVGLHIIAALLNPTDARTPRDEREKLIQARSHTVGYYVMLVGMMVTVLATHIPSLGEDLGLHSFMVTVYLGAGVMVIASLAVAIAQIIMFRRGA
ncbi:MAG TPA: hypothetical protein VGO52_24370 [Hyphomonadaceae bacterium]|jgi:uncharacterized membrane protein YidH (DUF202 family)|nr:hypothetical protein [Hyphomonadaceae bacterium]